MRMQIGSILVFSLLAASCGQPANQTASTTGNAALGRAAFIEKGCVLCHSVNGVGGKAAPPLDAQTEFDTPDALEFAARLWRGAPAMVELQSLELGYTIWLTADDIANLAAFNANANAQKELSLDQVPAELQETFLDQRFWEAENWDEFLRQGQEGMGEPPADEEGGQ